MILYLPNTWAVASPDVILPSRGRGHDVLVPLAQPATPPLVQSIDHSSAGTGANGFIIGEQGTTTSGDYRLCVPVHISASGGPHPTPSPAISPVSGHRSRELEWRRTHQEVLRNFVDQWVVLEGENVVAHGEDPQQVVAEARARGIRIPYIFRVKEPSGESTVTLEW